MTRHLRGKKIIRRIVSPIQEFIQDSRAVGITLIVCTAISLIISNTGWSAAYLSFWETPIHVPVAGLKLPHNILYFINDALMSLFFLLVGIEIKRELLIGELSSVRKAALPIFAAIGGMVVPALLYAVWNHNSGFLHGWGVPMATDIAFSLGILSLLGSKAPLSLKVLLAALAIIDDLGAIIAIAIFYTDTISWMYLALAGGLFLVLLGLNFLKVHRNYIYFLTGLLLWYCMFNSGVHATLAGVLLAFAFPLKKIPALEHTLHDPVSFIILPLFALANTAIVFPDEVMAVLASPVSYGVMTGLFIGKPVGISLAALLTVKLKLAHLPDGLRWKHIIGMGMIAGIGFTMSIFISILAYESVAAQTTAKLAVIIASICSGLAGYCYLNALHRKKVGSKPTKGADQQQADNRDQVAQTR